MQRNVIQNMYSFPTVITEPHWKSTEITLILQCLILIVITGAKTVNFYSFYLTLTKNKTAVSSFGPNFRTVHKNAGQTCVLKTPLQITTTSRCTALRKQPPAKPVQCC